MRTIDEANKIPYISEEQMKSLCRQFAIYGKYVEYRPASESSLAGLYFVCGDYGKVEEVAANNHYIHDNNHVDPAWVSLRETRNPDYFYTDAFAFNMSSVPPVVAYAKIGEYCKNYEAMHTIFKEFKKEIPKKIELKDLVTIKKLNAGRFNKDYPTGVQKQYEKELRNFMDKHFTKYKEKAEEFSPFVPLSYFEEKGADIRFKVIYEDSYHRLVDAIKSDPEKYADLKLYAGKKESYDLGIPKSTSLSEYNPWRNEEEESHVEHRTIAFRDCDEAVINEIFLSSHEKDLNMAVSVEKMFEHHCYVATIPVSYLTGFDERAQELGLSYAVDTTGAFSESDFGLVSIVYAEKDLDKAHEILSGIILSVNRDHTLGEGQRASVENNFKKSPLEDLISSAKISKEEIKKRRSLRRGNDERE